MDNNTNIFDYHASSEITFYMEDFEGPIELLVHLCKINNFDIHTVKMASITDQYLKYIERMQESTIDLDKATDFLLMAATLLEIKAKASLPKDDEDIDEDIDEIDSEEELRRRMVEYTMFKEKAEEIKTYETLNRFYREPYYTESDARISIVGFNLEKLMEAYAKLLFTYTKEEEIVGVKTIERDEFTVAHQLDYIVNRLTEEKELKFFSLFKEDFSRGEIITTFLALLQLVGKQFAVIVQELNMGDIAIALNEDCNPDTYDYSVLAMEDDEIG